MREMIQSSERTIARTSGIEVKIQGENLVKIGHRVELQRDQRVNWQKQWMH